jgi:hypothetical protein
MMLNKSDVLKDKSAQLTHESEAQDNISSAKIMTVSNDSYAARKKKLLAKEEFCCDRATD